MSDRKDLGLGLIGCGAFGDFCLNAYSKLDGVRIAAVADVRSEVAEAFGAQFGVPAHADAAGLVAQDDVDIVHIATPPSTHHDLALLATKAGKHVLCEKPLATSLADADEMLAAADLSGAIMPVNFVLRYNAVTDAVKAIIESGVLGRVLSARLTNCAGDTPLGLNHWFWNKPVSGGIFLEHAVHFFDLYTHWLGPGEIISAHVEQREGTGQEDRVMCTVRHQNGAVASQYHGFDQMALMDRTDHRLVCETGDIRVDGWIPLSLSVDAAVDDAGQERLAELCPGTVIEVAEEYTGERGRTSGRGKDRTVTRRVRLSFCPQPDKQRVYADSVSGLLADQVAFIRDPSHARRVTEQNGRAAVALAEAATTLAGQGA
jgi:predicted dehydrogenase